VKEGVRAGLRVFLPSCKVIIHPFSLRASGGIRRCSGDTELRLGAPVRSPSAIPGSSPLPSDFASGSSAEDLRARRSLYLRFPRLFRLRLRIASRCKLDAESKQREAVVHSHSDSPESSTSPRSRSDQTARMPRGPSISQRDNIHPASGRQAIDHFDALLPAFAAAEIKQALDGRASRMKPALTRSDERAS